MLFSGSAHPTYPEKQLKNPKKYVKFFEVFENGEVFKKAAAVDKKNLKLFSHTLLISGFKISYRAE